MNANDPSRTRRCRRCQRPFPVSAWEAVYSKPRHCSVGCALAVTWRTVRPRPARRSRQNAPRRDWLGWDGPVQRWPLEA